MSVSDSMVSDSSAVAPADVYGLYAAWTALETWITAHRLCILAAAGFGTFEDPPAKMTYSGAYSGGAWELYVDGNDCGSTPPEGPRDEDGTGYGFLAATPLWDGKCFNKNCAREDGNRDGGKTGGWTKNYKKCNTVESETDLMFLDAESPNRRR